MSKVTTILKCGMAAITLIATGACVPKAAQHSGFDTPKRNEVEMVRLTHQVRFDGLGEISDAEAGRINNFLNRIEYSYGDIVSLDTGSNTSADSQSQSVNAYLSRSGIWLASTAPVSGPAPAPGTAYLVVDKYVVTAPDCMNWTEDQSSNWANAPMPSFGCSSQTLLGLMVANPRDLIQGQAYTGPMTDAAVDAIIVSRIARGQTLSLGISLTNAGRIGSTAN